jgi:hypothetical protein
MPPLTRNNGQRELQVMIANPARQAHAVATGQQRGFSGQIPGTDSDPTQLAALSGTIQSYPDGPSPNGDQVAGVGHQVLNNAGNPAVFMGNLNAISGGASSKLPVSYRDGGFGFIDAAGNHVAGYSQPTGLYGFGVMVHKASFAYNTADLTAGVDIPFTDNYIPTDGDWLMDVWLEITTQWDGTAAFDLGYTGSQVNGWFFGMTDAFNSGGFTFSPGLGINDVPVDADLLQFSGGGAGISSSQSYLGPLSLFAHDVMVSGNYGVNRIFQVSGTTLAEGEAWEAYVDISPQAIEALNAGRSMPAKFNETAFGNPIQMWVSGDGTAGGPDPGCSVGAATLYVATVRP